MARRSVPGQVKRKTFYAEGYDMQYFASRKTNTTVPGHFWNPPMDCPRRVIIVNDERWVDVLLCRTCRRHSQCKAKDIKTKIKYEDLDTPRNRQRRSQKRGRRRS